jgi:hypothetical protein
VNSIGELFRLCEVRQFRFHPYHVAVRCVSNRAVDGALAATLIPVIALSCPCSFPIEVHIYTSQALCNGASFSIAFAFALFRKLAYELLLIYVHSSINCVSYCFVVKLHIRLLCPGVFDCLELGAILAGLLSSIHEIAERLKRWVGTSHYVVVVARVDGRGNKGGGFGISTSDCEKVGACSSVSIDMHRSFQGSMFLPMISACARIATNRLMCSLIGTSTFPAM